MMPMLAASSSRPLVAASRRVVTPHRQLVGVADAIQAGEAVVAEQLAIAEGQSGGVEAR